MGKMLEPWSRLFEELISIRSPRTYLSLLPSEKGRKLFEHSERERDMGLKYAAFSHKLFFCFLHLSSLSLGSNIPKEIWREIVIITLEREILDRVSHCEKWGKCYSLERNGIIKYRCHDISTTRREVDEDSFIFKRELYNFKNLLKGGKPVKIKYPPHLFSENWIKYGTVVEEFIESYEKDRRAKYANFFLTLLVIVLLCCAPSRDFALHALEILDRIIVIPLDLLFYFAGLGGS